MKKTYGLCVIVILLASIGLFIGRYDTSVYDIIQALIGNGDHMTHSLVWNIRLPRIMLVLLSGGALALSGVVYQTVFKNPLASGDVIGASSGCSLGAMIAILCAGDLWMIVGFSFIGGLIIVLCTILLASKVKGNRILNLVIAGLILQAVATSFMMIIKLQADPFRELANIEYWLMGGFSDASWSQVWFVSVPILLCCVCLYALRWQIQMLSFGEEADTLGVPVKRVRLLALLLATLLISSVISIAGIVSWVGLLVPHIIKMLYHQPLSKSFGSIFLCGSCFLLLCDTLARSLFAIELPISVLTSLFGALFLILLFLKGRLPL